MPPRMRGPVPPRNPYMFPPPRRQYPPMNPRGMRPPRQQGGGLLAKLLRKDKGPSQGGNPFALPVQPSRQGGSSGGIMKTLTDPNALNGFLTNTQKVLNSAQQIGPLVEQYGPVVKNLPALWKIYKGFKALPEEEANEKEKVEKVEPEKEEPRLSIEEKPTNHQTPRNRGTSKPKLYI